MVSDEKRREWRLLAQQYRIWQKSQNEKWPPAHQASFQCIRDLCQTTFEAYKKRIDVNSPSEFWKSQNLARAKWLVARATRLSNSGESSWRMHLENDILERFAVEVACPKCKHRLWRSDVESVYQGSSRVWDELDQRRLRRAPCTCPTLERPRDKYEIGTSRLFEERMDVLMNEFEPLSNLPELRPDRFIGLRETRNIRQLLEQPARFLLSGNADRVRDRVRSNPFRDQSIPVLFPFLVLEAKSDSAGVSFSDIQTQTAFPIRSLLNLQKELQSSGTGTEAGEEPLVWFLGYRGTDWKVYGCYIDRNFGSNPNYNIHCLQSGDLTTNDGALQLLLLVDHIVDWARDVFRTTIITRLTALATGVDFNQVPSGPDSDIASKKASVLDWMSRIDSDSRLGDTLRASRADYTAREGLEDSVPSVTLPVCELGAVRSASTAVFQLAGLRVTEGNVASLLTLSNNPESKSQNPVGESGNFREAARKLFSEIMRWKEVLLVLGADLDYVEHAWTNESVKLQAFDEGPGAEFYVVFEYRCFINVKWQVIRQLSYFAISKKAYNMLKYHTAYRRKHPRTDHFAQAPRSCSSSLIKEAIDCLRSGSAWQVVHSAISSTLFTLCPQPERVRDYDIPPVVTLGLGYQKSVQIRYFIEEFMSLAKRRSSKRNSAWEEKTANRSFRRISQREVHMLHDPHIELDCPRCRTSAQKLFAPQSSSLEISPMSNVWKAILVSSLQEENEDASVPQERHDITLFVFATSFWQESNTSIATIVEDLAQNHIYHAILHLPTSKSLILSSRSPCKVWNLPMSHREKTPIQQWDIERWVGELINGRVPPDKDITKKSLRLWTHQQILLYFLQEQKSYYEALEALEFVIDMQRNEDGASVPSNGTQTQITFQPRSISLRRFFWHYGIEQRQFEEERRLSGE